MSFIGHSSFNIVAKMKLKRTLVSVSVCYQTPSIARNVEIEDFRRKQSGRNQRNLRKVSGRLSVNIVIASLYP